MRTALLAASLGLVAAIAPAVGHAASEQLRSQVERGLQRYGVEIDGGVASLSDRQVAELHMELIARESDPAREMRLRTIIRRDDDARR